MSVYVENTPVRLFFVCDVVSVKFDFSTAFYVCVSFDTSISVEECVLNLKMGQYKGIIISVNGKILMVVELRDPQ